MPKNLAIVDPIVSVIKERQRQDGLWGTVGSRSAPQLKILVEEVGEVARAMQEIENIDGIDATTNLEEWELEYRLLVNHLREELVQVAAVAVAMVEAIDLGDVPTC